MYHHRMPNSDVADKKSMPVSLYQNCECLNLEEIFNNPKVPNTGIAILDLEKCVLGNGEKKCHLCHFFETKPSYAKKLYMHVRLFTCIEQGYSFDPAQKLYSTIVSDIPQQPFLCVLPKKLKGSYGYQIKEVLQKAGVVCYIPRKSRTTFQLCTVNATRANWEAITRQLEYCNMPR